LLSRTGSSTVIFGYNGRDGVITDGNGLIYMRARYYSPDMRRFINADVVAGDISNAITLNRFAYANGNPVSMSDPFGLSAADQRGNASFNPKRQNYWQAY
jgi:RHS repeat-associated protein